MYTDTEVVVTLFCAYAAFFIAEKELESSGVLTLVTTVPVCQHMFNPLLVALSCQDPWNDMKLDYVLIPPC
eukprot:4429160-Amphidinium_carterae.2